MDSTQKQSEPSVKNKKHKLLYGMVIFLLVVSAGGCVFWYQQYHQALAKNPNNQQKDWVNQLADTVVMPDEQPLITTVLDKSKLTNATLASEAKNGDRLYIFAKSHRIILYRPIDKKVVDMLTIQAK